MRFFITLFFLFLLSSTYGQSLETVVQRGHELAVVAVAASTDSNYVATASKDKSAKLWEVSTGREVRSFLGHEATVTSIDFSADGQYLITGSNDKTVRLWNVETGATVFTIETGYIITDVAVDPQLKFFIYAGYNNTGNGDTATVYDWKTRRIVSKIAVAPDQGRGSGVDVAISADGQWLALGEDNRQVSLYETRTWQKVKTLKDENGYCGGCGTRVAFSADSKALFVAAEDGSIRKYDVMSFSVQQTFVEKVEDMTGLALSADGKRLAVATENEVTIWDTMRGGILAKVPADEQGKFHEITFSTDARRLWIASDNNTAFAWEIKKQKRDIALTGFLNARDKGGLNYDPNFYWQSHIARYIRFKNTICISNDGKTLIKGKFGTKVKRWDIATGRSVMEYAGHKKAVLCYDLSADGKKLLTGGGDGKIILWDVATGDSLQVIHGYHEPVFDIHFSAGETKVASSSWDGTLKIHDLQTRKTVTYLPLDNASAYNIIYHPNDLYLFTARLDNTLQMWEPDTKTVVRQFTGHTDVISSISLSKDHTTLLSGSWDGSIRLWDVGTGLMMRKMRTQSGAVHTAIFSPDEKMIYSAGADRMIYVWDVTSGMAVKKLAGHKAEITSLLFSPDNKMLISHSLDGVTKFWNLSSGEEFFEHIHLGENDWLVKNPSGYFNGTDDARKYIHFVKAMKTYAVDQFFEDYYRPDLLPKIFHNRGQGDDHKKGIHGKLEHAPPPTVKVAVLPVSEGKGEVYVRITNNGAGVKDLRLLHNGKSIFLSPEELRYPPGKGEVVTYKKVIDLVGGVNTFSATASNHKNVESDAHIAEIFSENAVNPGVCYVLAVGINEYKNEQLKLNYARADAQSFEQILGEKGSPLFKNIVLHRLYDGEATRSKILSTLDVLASQVNPEDVFIFYYAGHGSMVDDNFYFIPAEGSRLYDASSLQKEAIEAGVLRDKFRHIKALKQLIVMDACQSGGSVELLAMRGGMEEKAIAQLSRSAGIHVMASAGSEQFATEFSELGHGLFTYVLIKALGGEADGAPKDGKVTIYELKSYIDDQVPEMTRKLKGKPQYPHTFSRGQNFPVVIQK